MLSWIDSFLNGILFFVIGFAVLNGFAGYQRKANIRKICFQCQKRVNAPSSDGFYHCGCGHVFR